MESNYRRPWTSATPLQIVFVCAFRRFYARHDDDCILWVVLMALTASPVDPVKQDVINLGLPPATIMRSMCYLCGNCLMNTYTQYRLELTSTKVFIASTRTARGPQIIMMKSKESKEQNVKYLRNFNTKASLRSKHKNALRFYTHFFLFYI